MPGPNPSPPPAERATPPPLGQRPHLEDHQVLALEAYADTVIPGRKRHPTDAAIVGISGTPGAVECGAVDVLTDPATGIEDGIGEMAELLDTHATAWADANDVSGIHRFADLNYTNRRTLVAQLTNSAEPQKDLWFLVALFSTMAYDSAPHLQTSDALDPEITPASGLRQMRFRPPTNGRWTFEPSSYRRPLARLRDGTDPNGDPR